MDEQAQQPTAANGAPWPAEVFLGGKVTLLAGDCTQVLPTLPADSFDSCCCDPPYHLSSIVKRFGQDGAAPAKSAGATGVYARSAAGFMGKQWDGGDIAFRPELWAEVLRVLKPGAYLVAFSSTRTFGRMSVAIEDAGFIVHPFVAWIFGQGFPKAHRITHSGLSDLDRATDGWDGWRYGGQTLKPAIEPIFMGQKPFARGLTGSQNVQRYGVGALNIDGCRIAAEGGDEPLKWETPRGGIWTTDPQAQAQAQAQALGRWPANVVHDGSQEVVGAFPEADGVVGAVHDPNGSMGYHGGAGGHYQAVRPDSGSTSRFFYTAKAGDDDRLGSKHPTVKPLDLMQWLVRLVTPPGGLVLDPFAGTGTTAEAAWREGNRAALIEREAEYQADIRRRMALCLSGASERKRESIKAKTAHKLPDHGPLFGPLARDGGDS